MNQAEKMDKCQNLLSSMLDEIIRVNSIIIEYRSLPGGAGMFAAAVMENAIERAKRAMAFGDVTEMLCCHQELKEFEL